MRKIEQRMNAAIIAKIDWKQDNTEVHFHDGVSFVFLHGNCIAQVRDNSISLFDGGWQSSTTKSRLNAILRVHGIEGECVFQKNFKWFIHKFIGNAGSSPVFVEQDFTNGMCLA
jgi:hypothetical protein